MAEDYGAYTLTDIAAQVKGKDAIRVERASSPLSRDDEFTRAWKVARHLQERVRVFLDLYGDGDQELTAEHHAIVSPASDGGVRMPGTWRVVRNFDAPDQPGMVFQTLRRGWITSLVTTAGTPPVTTVDWSEAVAADEEVGAALAGPLVVSPSTYGAWRRKVMRVIWRGVDPIARKAVVASLYGIAAANWTPVCRGESYDSGWHRLVVSDELTADGSVTITIVFAQAEAAFDFYEAKGTIRETIETVLHGVPVDLVQAYVDAFRRYGTQGANTTPPEGASAGGSVDLGSGLATLRFQCRGSDDADARRWNQRTSGVEKSARYPDGQKVYGADGNEVTTAAKYKPEDGYYWRWVYELAICRLVSSRVTAEGWASPLQHLATYACLPGSECRPAHGDMWLAVRVVARHYSYYFQCSERSINTATRMGYVLNSLAGVGNLSSGAI